MPYGLPLRRREAPEGPMGLLAIPEPNVVELWVTKKIKIIFFGLAAAEAAAPKKISQNKELLGTERW